MWSLFCIVFFYSDLYFLKGGGRVLLACSFFFFFLLLTCYPCHLALSEVLHFPVPFFSCVSAISQRRSFFLPSQTLSSLVRTALLHLRYGFSGLLSAPPSSLSPHVSLSACLFTVPSSVSFLCDLWFLVLPPFPLSVPLLGVSLAHLSFSFAASFSCLSIGAGTANITKIIGLRTGGSCAEDGLWICPECLGSIGNRSQLCCWRGVYNSGTFGPRLSYPFPLQLERRNAPFPLIHTTDILSDSCPLCFVCIKPFEVTHWGDVSTKMPSSFFSLGFGLGSGSSGGVSVNIGSLISCCLHNISFVSMIESTCST